MARFIRSASGRRHRCMRQGNATISTIASKYIVREDTRLRQYLKEVFSVF